MKIIQIVNKSQLLISEEIFYQIFLEKTSFREINYAWIKPEICIGMRKIAIAISKVNVQNHRPQGNFNLAHQTTRQCRDRHLVCCANYMVITMLLMTTFNTQNVGHVIVLI